MLRSTEAKAFEIEAIINYAFTEKRLAAEATQMAAPQIAAVHNNTVSGLDNNKRLSILGEAVLTREICSAWFQKRGPRGKQASAAPARMHH